MADEEPQRLSLDFATSLRGEASVKIDAVIISTAAATEVGLRDLDDTTLFRIKEGDEGAVPGPLRDWPFQLVRILAAKHHSDRETAKARSHSFWTAIFAGVIGAFLGAIFTALVTLG